MCTSVAHTAQHASRSEVGGSLKEPHAPQHNLLLSPIKQTVDDTLIPVTSPDSTVPTRLRREPSTVTGQACQDSSVSSTATTALTGAGQDLRLTQPTPCATQHQQESLSWHEINTRLQGFGFKRIRFIQLQVHTLELLSYALATH
jgi:hypothetical protein